jgi:NADPH-dependent glutamate synthase beta subunit-like oxidoreductase/NAD-dependent dihydropyrimidine dehydrogenase PreA subunit
MLGCAAGEDARQWIGIVAQRAQLGLTDSQAFGRAWGVIAETNPFPATLGRICPHPCESACNRAGKDGAVAINALERFLGDWALRRGLPLPRLEEATRGASIGVVGAGPAGLSFAYQLARRGHQMTLYERREHAGGMLRHGIPAFRLPKQILQAEIERIVALGVDLRLNVTVGRDVSVDELRECHDLLFLGIGAGNAARLGIPGEDGPGVIGGIEYLIAVNRGEEIATPSPVVVIGGGNTAIDAARAARRRGADVTLLYRRTREEMPAIDDEVNGALAEGVSIEFLVTPTAIRRDPTGPNAVVAQRMALGEPADSGRRRPVPLPGTTFAVPAQLVIAAVSQTVDWDGLEQFQPERSGLPTGFGGAIGDSVWSGGDVLGASIAGMAIAQGRHAAESVHAMLTSEAPPVAGAARQGVPARDVAADFYAGRPAAEVPEQPVADRLAQPDLEVHETLSRAAFLQEVERCFSCGQCHGCRYCFMYCNVGGFVRIDQARPGAYFALALDHCMGCGKCIELCPTGFLSPAGAAS